MRTSMLREVGSCGSRLLNVLFFGGTADVSLSARAYLDGRHVLRRRIDAVFAWFGDADHCRKWAKVEVERAREVVEKAGRDD